MCANSEGSGETARMRRFAWAFAGRLCDKYHNFMSCLILFPVCYREADDGQLDAFIEEVEQEGRLTGETKVLLEQLDEAPKAKEERKPTVSAPIVVYCIFMSCRKGILIAQSV